MNFVKRMISTIRGQMVGLNEATILTNDEDMEVMEEEEEEEDNVTFQHHQQEQLLQQRKRTSPRSSSSSSPSRPSSQLSIIKEEIAEIPIKPLTLVINEGLDYDEDDGLLHNRPLLSQRSDHEADDEEYILGLEFEDSKSDSSGGPALIRKLLPKPRRKRKKILEISSTSTKQSSSIHRAALSSRRRSNIGSTSSRSPDQGQRKKRRKKRRSKYSLTREEREEELAEVVGSLSALADRNQSSVCPRTEKVSIPRRSTNAKPALANTNLPHSDSMRSNHNQKAPNVLKRRPGRPSLSLPSCRPATQTHLKQKVVLNGALKNFQQRQQHKQKAARRGRPPKFLNSNKQLPPGPLSKTKSKRSNGQPSPGQSFKGANANEEVEIDSDTEVDRIRIQFQGESGEITLRLKKEHLDLIYGGGEEETDSPSPAVEEASSPSQLPESVQEVQILIDVETRARANQQLIRESKQQLRLQADKQNNEFLIKKIQRIQAAKKIYSQVMSHQCQVQLFDIGFISNVIRPINVQQYDRFLKKIGRTTPGPKFRPNTATMDKLIKEFFNTTPTDKQCRRLNQQRRGRGGGNSHGFDFEPTDSVEPCSSRAVRDSFAAAVAASYQLKDLTIGVVDVGESPTLCHVCDKYFPVRELDSHRLSHILECPICGVSVPLQEIASHGVIHVDRLNCQLCQYQAGTKLEMWNHMNKHAGLKPLICLLCGEAFATTTRFHRHHQLKHGGS